MQELTRQPNYLRPAAFDPKLKAASGLMLLSVMITLSILLYASGAFDTFNYLFLVPWILALLVVLAIPIAIFTSRSGKGFESPLMLATVSYFLPAFAFGGLSLAVGWSQPYYVDFIQDVSFTLPFTIFLIILGYAGLAAGFFLPVGKKVGSIVSEYLPERNHAPDSYLLPGLLLLGFGLFSSFYALLAGVIGFQRVDEAGIFDGIIFLSTLFPAQGSFILWWSLFRQGRFTSRSWMVAGIVVTAAIVTALFAGNRGTLLSAGIIVVMAYLLSGRRFTMRSSAVAIGLLLFALIAGMIYGTAFRVNKGSQERTGIGQYATNVGDTLTNIASGKDVASLEFGLTSLAQRLDIVSSLAVVVSNHEQLAPYEESYGLDNNIYKDTTYFFIPRALWPEKPLASDSKAYSDLYFEYDENSFAITPIGDLLRNFGVPGVFIGMLVLGVALRTIYRALVEDQSPNLLRATLYIMLIITVSYEGFYGTILPMLFKVGVTTLIGLVFIEIVATQIDRSGLRKTLRLGGGRERLSPRLR